MENEKNEFLFDLKTPETTWRGSSKHYFPNGEVASEAGNITDQEGPHRRFWMHDTKMRQMQPGTDMNTGFGAHFHHHGYETFFVDSGWLYLYVAGQRAIAREGDIIQLQAGQPHGMCYMEPVNWRGTFHDFEVYHEGREVSKIKKYMPELENDPELNALMTRGFMDKTDMEPFLFTDVPTEQCLAIKNISRPHASYDLPGVSMKIVVERWENGGAKELACAVMEKGFWAKWVRFPPLRELLYVRHGKVQFDIMGRQFVADDYCVVDIPRFAPHSIEALEKSEVYDLGGLSYWSLFFQNYTSILKRDPDRLTPETVEGLKKKFKIQIDSFGIK